MSDLLSVQQMEADCFLLSSGLVAAGAGAMNLDLMFIIFHSSRPDCAAQLSFSFLFFFLFVFVEHFIFCMKLSKHMKDAWTFALEVRVPSSFEFLQSLRNHLPNETWWIAVLTTLGWSCQWRLLCPAQCIPAGLTLRHSETFPKAQGIWRAPSGCRDSWLRIEVLDRQQRPCGWWQGVMVLRAAACRTPPRGLCHFQPASAVSCFLQLRLLVDVPWPSDNASI